MNWSKRNWDFEDPNDGNIGIDEQSYAVGHEPPPTEGKQEVYPELLKDIEARVLSAEREYGGRLKTFNGRDALKDAYQEAIDAAFYLKQALMERDEWFIILLDSIMKEYLSETIDTRTILEVTEFVQYIKLNYGNGEGGEE